MTDESQAGLSGKESELQVEFFSWNILVWIDMEDRSLMADG